MSPCDCLSSSRASRSPNFDFTRTCRTWPYNIYIPFVRATIFWDTAACNRLNLVGRRRLRYRASRAACLDVVIAVSERLWYPEVEHGALRACGRVSVTVGPACSQGAERRKGPQAPKSRPESVLPDWEGRLARGAQRCLLETFVSTVSLLAHDGRLSQHRPRIRQICEYNTKCAYKTDHASHAGPQGTRSPRLS